MNKYTIEINITKYGNHVTAAIIVFRALEKAGQSDECGTSSSKTAFKFTVIIGARYAIYTPVMKSKQIMLIDVRIRLFPIVFPPVIFYKYNYI